tara:strand:- start:778 stop:1242 length:465 start_codon:yes stop_codon:yes gene_type:complete
MSRDKFDFIILEIPSEVNLDMIKDLRSMISSIGTEEAVIINELLNLDASNASEGPLAEEDLFEIGEESLLIKKAVQHFLNEAVSEVIVPRLYSDRRLSSDLSGGEFSYAVIKGSPHVISGQQSSYYSSRLNLGYKYVLALSASNLLSTFISEKT